MKRSVVVAAVLALATYSGASLAVDVANEDNVSYMINVTEMGTTTRIEVPANETIYDVCDQCALAFEDEDGVKVEGDKVAVIKKRQFEIKDKN